MRSWGFGVGKDVFGRAEFQNDGNGHQRGFRVSIRLGDG